MSDTEAPTTEPTPTCSAKGCQAPAVWALLWNNPKLHTPERRKTWLACDEHRTSLSDFLGARGFLKDVVTLTPDGFIEAPDMRTSRGDTPVHLRSACWNGAAA